MDHPPRTGTRPPERLPLLSSPANLSASASPSHDVQSIRARHWDVEIRVCKKTEPGCTSPLHTTRLPFFDCSADSLPSKAQGPLLLSLAQRRRRSASTSHRACPASRLFARHLLPAQPLPRATLTYRVGYLQPRLYQRILHLDRLPAAKYRRFIFAQSWLDVGPSPG